MRDLSEARRSPRARRGGATDRPCGSSGPVGGGGRPGGGRGLRGRRCAMTDPRAGQAERGEHARQEDERPEAQHPGRPDLQQTDAQGERGKAGQRGEHGELGVRTREVVTVTRDLGDERGAGDEVQLRQHQDPERLREEEEVVHVARHRQAEEGGAAIGDRHARAARLAAAVEQGAQGGADHGEGRDRQQQVEEDLALGGVRRDREEERAGERDRDERAARSLDRVDEGESPEGLGLVE